jgi:CRP/FNR family transcriptional regulator
MTVMDQVMHSTNGLSRTASLEQRKRPSSGGENRVDQRTQSLSRFALFAGLDQAARRGVALRIRERTFVAGTLITFADEPCKAVYLILRGQVRVCHQSTEGREYVLNDLGPGQAFNLASAFGGGHNLATVRSLAETTVYIVPCHAFQQIVREHNAVAWAVMAHLAGRTRDLSETVEDLALRTVRARLARCLLCRSEDSGSTGLRWTQADIAAHIGTVRDVVGRALRDFAQEGWIHRQRGQIVVMDRSALRHEAMYG